MALFARMGYPDVAASSARQAARCFADLQAKREYGAGGRCTFLAATSASALSFRVFIGNLGGLGLTNGHDVLVTVERKKELIPA
jgi:hypothetical protein